MAYVDIETPEGSRRIALERERLSIGRLATNDVVLAFPQVSRQHAELRSVNGQWWIADLHSTNGLQLDARRIRDHALRDGDRVVLAPGISVRFVAAGAAADGHASPASAPLWSESRPHEPSAPHANPRARAGRSHAAQPTPEPLASPAQPAPGPFSGIAGIAGRGLVASGSASDAASPFELWSAARTAGPAPTVPVDPSESDAYASVANGPRVGSGYPVPRGPLHSGAPVGGDDPYRRDAPAGDAGRATGGPATLLHICQTCGQRTAPSAISCQHCHNPIASECANCRLSLLPIQDRCPRCHTPNLHSVRRVHARHTAL